MTTLLFLLGILLPISAALLVAGVCMIWKSTQVVYQVLGAVAIVAGIVLLLTTIVVFFGTGTTSRAMPE